MRLKSETKQTIKFIELMRATNFETVAEICKGTELNLDMVHRGLHLLHKAGVISRNSRGRDSSYLYPKQIGLGDVIDSIEGINVLGDGYIQADVIEALNSVKL